MNDFDVVAYLVIIPETGQDERKERAPFMVEISKTEIFLFKVNIDLINEGIKEILLLSATMMLRKGLSYYFFEISEKRLSLPFSVSTFTPIS